MSNPDTQAGPLASGTRRFRAGIGILVLAYGAWLAVPVAASAGASPAHIATLTGAIVVANKIMLMVSVAVMGKPGFLRVKEMMLQHLRGVSPDDTVGPVRHAVGLAMFCLPLLSAMLEPYIDAIWPDLRPRLWEAQLLGDVMLIASVFVLGGEFWNKVRALFIRTARVVDYGEPGGGV